jgi:hypothetical protein
VVLIFFRRLILLAKNSRLLDLGFRSYSKYKQKAFLKRKAFKFY